MLIAFGIGEHLELKRLQKTAGTVLSICLADMLLAFLLVAGGIFTAAWLTSSGGPGWQLKEYMVLALILATVSIATAPGTILFITRECRAVGALTTALLQVVAVNNGLAIVLFGVALVLARQVVGVDQTIPGIILVILAKTSFSLLLGMACCSCVARAAFFRNSSSACRWRGSGTRPCGCRRNSGRRRRCRVRSPCPPRSIASRW